MTFVHSLKYYTCNNCPIKTRTDAALKYHIEIKHNLLLEMKEPSKTLPPSQEKTTNSQVLRKTLKPQHSEKKDLIEDKQEDISIKTEPVDNGSILECEFCEKFFITSRGLLVHTSKTHKEEYRNKRKTDKEQDRKCYICGFTFISEETFKAHTEEIHNQEYTIHRNDSITKSPPTKKVKGYQNKNMEVDHLDIVKLKDEKITELELKKIKKIEANEIES